MKNIRELYEKISTEDVKEKLMDMFSDLAGEKRTSYTQNLIMKDDGTLTIYRLGQNETLEKVWNGTWVTLYSEEEYDLTDIPGWELQEGDTFKEMYSAYRAECIDEWVDQALERIDENIREMREI